MVVVFVLHPVLHHLCILESPDSHAFLHCLSCKQNQPFRDDTTCIVIRSCSLFTRELLMSRIELWTSFYMLTKYEHVREEGHGSLTVIKCTLSLTEHLRAHKSLPGGGAESDIQQKIMHFYLTDTWSALSQPRLQLFHSSVHEDVTIGAWLQLFFWSCK